MSGLDLDAIQQRAEAATPGPWTIERWEDFAGKPSYSVDGAIRWRGFINTLNCEEDKLTAEFIAHARTDVPALIARIRELEQKNTTLGIERARVADALDRVAAYGRNLTEVFKPHTTHAEVGREIARHIAANPRPSESGDLS